MRRSGRPGKVTKGAVAQAPSPAYVLTRRHAHALLLLILFVAALLRLYQISSVPPGLFPDEAMNGNTALQALETGHFAVFYPDNHGQEGLYINIVAPFVLFFGNHPWTVRLPSTIFGILTVWGIYCLGAEMFSMPIGLLASFFSATSFWHIDISRVSGRAIAAPFFLVWALYALFVGIRRARQHQPYLAAVLTAGVVYGLGFHTYTIFRVTPPLVLGIIGYCFLRSRNEGWRRAFWKASIAFLTATALTVLPLLLYFVHNPGQFLRRAAEVSVTASPHPVREAAINAWKVALMFFAAGDQNWRQNYAGRPEIFLPVAILFAMGIIVALAPGLRRKQGLDALACAVALTWLLLATVPGIFSDEGVPHAQRTILSIPAAFILAAIGAQWVYGYLSPKVPPNLRPVALGLLFLILCYEPYYWYFDKWAGNSNVPLAFTATALDTAAEINAIPRAVPKYLVVATTSEDPQNGIPLLDQTVVFLTRSYTKLEQDEANIHYILPDTAALLSKTPLEYCQEFAASKPGAEVFCLTPEK
jgi:4-amino-4-deoxy-L-arabinose transferase-like glycosyltransferase